MTEAFKNQKGSLSTPVAIVLAGALIAVALYFALASGSSTQPNTPTAALPTADDFRSTAAIANVQSDDHIKGSANAEIVIIEYSDTECPFCKRHHTTLQRLVDDYEGRVAWVYRNFPIPQLHAKAPREAEALECAAELGGNSAFWAYTDRLYEITPSNDGLQDSQLFDIAEFAGLDTAVFTTCLESGDMNERVEADFNEVAAAGGRGTPHNILLVGGEQVALEGAIPFESGVSSPGMQELIEALLDRGNDDPAEVIADTYLSYLE